MRLKKYKILGFFALLSTVYFLLSTPLNASRVDDLRQSINEKNSQMEQVQKEIDEYKKQLETVADEKNTLNNEIKRLEITLKKLNSDINYTGKKIDATDLNIERLDIEIANKIASIGSRRITLAETIRNIDQSESVSLVEITLGRDKFSDFFGDLERMENFQKEVNVNLEELKSLKEILESEKNEKESEKSNLEQLKSNLSDQKYLADSNKSAKNKLLNTTKNKEENYKKLLADRLAKQKALEGEIMEIEEQIRVEIDPNSLPQTGTGILKWPLDQIKITQYFGNTTFATQNPQVYNGKGHNGVDFRASVGTPVKSSADGFVKATGDTDKECRGVSYGKWVLIEHNNGLSTLYAHFSLIKVSAGQQIKTSQVIGYSGDTGYCTGPHLHYTVFATQGVKIGQIKSKICGTMLTLPIASLNSYLNPLSYLGI